MVKEISKTLNELSIARDRYTVYYDFFKILAITLNNSSDFYHDEAWQERENDYLATVKKYTREEMEQFTKCFQLLLEKISDDMGNGVYRDWLGEIYSDSGIHSRDKGQFFTPYSVSKLVADTNIAGDVERLKKKRVISLCEPACGAGSMVVAFCHALRDNGINYQKKLLAYANDSDERCFYMTYIQLSLVGCPAFVECKNAITNEQKIAPWRTPFLKFQPWLEKDTQ